jgi:hypothetical protein
MTRDPVPWLTPDDRINLDQGLLFSAAGLHAIPRREYFEKEKGELLSSGAVNT